MRVLRMTAIALLLVTLVAGSSYTVVAASLQGISKISDSSSSSRLSESYEAVVDMITQPSNGNASRYSAAASVKSTIAPTDNYSVVNTQIVGIDEADTIKTDGRYLYTLNGKKIYIVAINGANMTLLSSIVPDDSMDITGFYVEGDILVLIGNTYERFASPVLDAKDGDKGELMSMNGISASPSTETNSFPGVWYKPFVVYEIYNISDRMAPVRVHRFELSGTNIATRLTDGKLYYAVSYDPYYTEDFDASIHTVSTVSSDMQLPSYVHNDRAFYPEMENVYYFPDSSSASSISMGVINLIGEPILAPKVYFGNGKTFYMDYDNIVISCDAWSNGSSSTHLYRFEVGGEGIIYKADSRIDDPAIDGYSLNIHNNNVCVVTYSQLEGNRVLVYDEKMKVIGSTERFAIGEPVCSVHFLGDIAYAVTSRAEGSAYVIDLSNPAEPKVLGELEIPGFSQYLYPLGDGLLIGFGSDFKADGYGGYYDTGIKVSLLDVTDLRNPKEIDVLKYGDNEYYSATLTNPRSMFVDSSRKRIGFSVVCADGVDFSSSGTSSNNAVTINERLAAQVWYGISFVDIDNYKLVERGNVVQGLANGNVLNNVIGYNYEPSEEFTVRAVCVGDILYTVANGEIKARNYDTFDLLDSIPLDVMTTQPVILSTN